MFIDQQLNEGMKINMGIANHSSRFRLEEVFVVSEQELAE